MPRAIHNVAAIVRACRPPLRSAGCLSSTAATDYHALSHPSDGSCQRKPSIYQQRRQFHQSRSAAKRKSRKDVQKETEDGLERLGLNFTDQETTANIKQLAEEEAQDANTREEAEEIRQSWETPADNFVREFNERDEFGTPEIGLFGENEENTEDPLEDEDFQGDDISSSAHAELEHVREMRELHRACAWDMPQLWAQVKPFTPPTASQPLQFRYSTYFGEFHPASRKVVVSFTPSKLDAKLTEVQLNKMIKLLGPRYNPSTNTAKMSCELYPTVPQNKRWLGDMVDKLLAESKDPTKDTFEDIPFDFRHHTPKKTFKFPEEWSMNEGKRKSLMDERNGRTRAQFAKMQENLLIDGRQIADTAMSMAAEVEEQPVMVEAGRLTARRR